MNFVVLALQFVTVLFDGKDQYAYVKKKTKTSTQKTIVGLMFSVLMQRSTLRCHNLQEFSPRICLLRSF